MRLIIIFLTLVVFASCNTGNSWNAGPTIRQERNIPSFNELSVYGSFDVIISEDSVVNLVVEGPEMAVNGIFSQVGSKRLLLDYRGHGYGHAVSKINAYIGLDSITDIFHAGSGNLSGNLSPLGNFHLESTGSGNVVLDLQSPAVDVKSSGSGSVTISGSTNRLNVRKQGSGTAQFSSLGATYVNISSEGSGDTYVSASDSLVVSLEGSGNVYYYGNPGYISQAIIGSGKLIKIN